MKNDLYMLGVSISGIRRRISKTAVERGRKWPVWVPELHRELFDEYCKLWSCGVKFNSNFPLLIAKQLVADSTSKTYGPTVRDQNLGKLVSDHMDAKRMIKFTF